MRHPLLLLPALLLLAAGCQNGRTVEGPAAGKDAAGDSVTIVSPLSHAMTRTELRQDGGTGNYDVFWSLDDRIGVFSANTVNSEFTLNETGEDLVAFQGLIAGTPTCAYYPYSEDAGDDPEAVTLTLPASQSQTGSDPNMAYDVKSGQKTGGDAESGYTFDFNQQFTLLHFIIDPGENLEGNNLVSVSLTVAGAELAGDYTLDLTDAGAAADFGGEGSETVRLTFTDTHGLTDGEETEAWLFINPDIQANDELTITLTTNLYRVTTTGATAGANFTRGAVYDIRMGIDTLLAQEKLSVAPLNGDFLEETDPGLYGLTSGCSAIHPYVEFEDQYTCRTTSGGDYVFTVQGLKNAKLSRLTADSDALEESPEFSATLYTIHGATGVTEAGYWRVVKRDNTKYWVMKADGTQGFIILKEED